MNEKPENTFCNRTHRREFLRDIGGGFASLLDCEQYIEEAMAEHATAQCPPLLAQALNYSVFPGGARVRPQLCKAVALANNSSDVGLANAAATAVELLHCASLVHVIVIIVIIVIVIIIVIIVIIIIIIIMQQQW